MVVGLKQPHSKPSFREPLLETRTAKTSEVPSVGSPKNYKLASKINTSLFPPTITHSNWNTCLRTKLCPNMSAFPNIKPLYVIAVAYFMAFDTMFHPLSFRGTKSGIPNHVMDILNPVPTFSHQEHCMYQTTCPHSTNQLQHHSNKGNHDTLYCSTTLPFKQPSSRDIRPISNYTSNTTRSRIHW